MSGDAFEESAESLPDDDDGFRIHRYARMSARLGIAGMGLCMAAPVTCGLSYLPALPVAFGAVFFAQTALPRAIRDTPTRAYAKVGVVTGVTALVVSLIANALLFAYLSMCFGVWALDSM